VNLRPLLFPVLLALPAWTNAQRASPGPAQEGPEAESIPDSAFEFLQPLRGESGALRVAFRAAGSPLSSRMPAPGISVLYQGDEGDALVSDRVPELPGVYGIVVKSGEKGRTAKDLKLVTLVPFAEKKQGRIGRYEIGFWPYEAAKPRSRAYASPAGFVEVTRDNKSLQVSKHLKLEDFLTKGQDDVWPKYLVLDPRLLDKLELIQQDLEASGRKAERFHVMSGFRTPAYNEQGGDPRGRGELSRHMWGDAADVWVDNDGDGAMDDLNGDERVDMDDSREIAAAAERVEDRYPALAGGIGPYPACCGHGPFTHVDARGSRARWQGPHGQAAPKPAPNPAKPAPGSERD
jgi:hypothetical protein